MTDIETIQLIWIFFSLITLIKWLKRHDLGRNSLTGACLPDNNLSLADIPLAMLSFICISGLTTVFTNENTSLPVRAGLLAGLNIITICILGYIIKSRFTGGIRAIFADCQHPGKDIITALLYSVPAFGLAAFALSVTISACALLGYENIQQHEFLKELSSGSIGITGIMTMYLSAAIVTPIMEEFLFRGIVQNSLIRYSGSNWRGIIASAVLFALMHANAQHFPALIVLGCCFGYAYSKTGSLLTAITMHAAFNAMNITGTILKLAS
ncbi:MAG: CPBP family intramembrane metalloprotease [Sedimentisphaerales bacterium]|nr:CPBP family intramembrane metalloprotease [Sedimentisphaerales bacterium]MBN2842075.1 CPBP family intramembrane metalloprotease [Sedimentisphaerales bacterium]